MKKFSEKTLIIIAGILILLGGVLYANGSIKHIEIANNSLYMTNSYTITDPFENVYIDTAAAEIVFELSDSSTIQVICYEASEDQHRVSINNNTLFVSSEAKNNNVSLQYSPNTETPTITIILPQGEYGKITIDNSIGNTAIPQGYLFRSMDLKSDTGSLNCHSSASNEIRCDFDIGNINLSNLSAGMLYLESNNGEINLNNITCNGDIDIENSIGTVKMNQVTCSSLSCDNSTGAITLTDVICKDFMKLENDTGEIAFKDCDANNVEIETGAGSISGHFLTGKTYIAKSGAGSVRVPENSGSGRCAVTTDIGNINIY